MTGTSTKLERGDDHLIWPATGWRLQVSTVPSTFVRNALYDGPASRSPLLANDNGSRLRICRGWTALPQPAFALCPAAVLPLGPLPLPVNQLASYFKRCHGPDKGHPWLPKLHENPAAALLRSLHSWRTRPPEPSTLPLPS